MNDLKENVIPESDEEDNEEDYQPAIRKARSIRSEKLRLCCIKQLIVPSISGQEDW
jgi:hypothetical protein